jgi:endonuclease YncB( thermonuclease family)
MANGRRIPSFRQRSETGRWTLALVVLAGSVSVYVYEKLTRTPDTPIVGLAQISDGDTIRIEGQHIRLLDIDAPELDQTCEDANRKEWLCGASASNELRKYLRGRTINCQPRGFDKYHRVLATCTLSNGSDINAWLVQQGWAVTSGYAKVYETQESEARLAKRGIWQGSFMEPRQWRDLYPREQQVNHPK